MQLWTRLTLVACLWGATGCGSGGDSGVAGGNLGGEVGELALLEHEPADDALGVPTDTEITLRFDGAIDEHSLMVEELTLVAAGSSEAIPGSFRQGNGGRTVYFQPAAELDEATDYRFKVAPTLCDRDFRTLDASPSFTFRTVDSVPPVLSGASVIDRTLDVDRRAPIVFEFDEALDPDSVRPNAFALRDEWATLYPITTTLVGRQVHVQCRHDLPGSKQLILTLRGGSGSITDRSGNAYPSEHTLRFGTVADTRAPSFVRSFPSDSSADVSPHARVELVFDESMDPDSYEPSKLRLVDAFENDVPCAVTLSPDLRTVRLTPEGALRTDDVYRVEIENGVGALSDVSGNPLGARVVLSFRTGTDTDLPRLTSSLPAHGAKDVPTSARYTLQFNEELRPSSVHGGTVRLLSDGVPVATTLALQDADTAITVQAVEALPLGALCALEVTPGADGLQDAHGNPLGAAVRIEFTTTQDARVPELFFAPYDFASSVPTTSRVVVQSSIALDPASIDDNRVEVRDMHGARISGDLALTREGRAIVFTPRSGLPSTNVVQVVVRSGLGGIRGSNGSVLAQDEAISFRTAGHADAIAPEITVTVNGIAKSRSAGLVLPRSGFTFDISSYDLGGSTVDPSSLELTLDGPGSVPSSDELFAMTSFSGNLRARTRIAAADELDLGSYTLTARVRDTSGNTSAGASLVFEVGDASREFRPFERVQIVWAMFDSDREGGGRGDAKADFDEDLLDFGLTSEGDPIGSNARMAAMVRDGAVRVANTIFGRSATGAPVDEDSIRLRLVTAQPCSAPHMKIAIGGLDPSGDAQRKYGDDSTGVLGRALFDYRNAVPNENNTATSPGLGVFVSELFLYQARLYLDLYPHYITRFGRTYGGLSPHMGGTPAGKHTHDAKVLAADFDYGAASPEERARWDAIHTAADHLARAIGVILAHEIGHSIGLVPTGEPSGGLHGDQTLHNRSAGIDDVMSAILGYESLTTVDFQFRPLNLAYLRERVILK